MRAGFTEWMGAGPPRGLALRASFFCGLSFGSGYNADTPKRVAIEVPKQFCALFQSLAPWHMVFRQGLHARECRDLKFLYPR